MCVCVYEGCGERQQRSPEVLDECVCVCFCAGMGEECVGRASGRAGLIH